MKTFYPCLCLVLYLLHGRLIAQIKAITDTGDEIILLDNKTWRYKIEKNKIDFDTNKNSSETNNSNSLIKSDIGDFGVNINPNIIKTNSYSFNKDAEFTFVSKDGKFWALFMTEKISVPLKFIKDFKIKSMKEKTDSLEILQEDDRIVNGMKIMHVKLKGTSKNFNFIYCIYFASSDSSTSQLFSYCLESDFENNRENMYKFLNGFTQIK